jgi:hypothetical protein
MANYIPKIEYIELNTGTPKTVQFDHEPEGDPLNEEFKTSSTVTTSNNGQRQTQFNNTRKQYSLEFLFQSQTVKDAFVDFFNNHAVKGGKFDYYIHSDEITFEEFEIEGKSLKLNRVLPEATDFEYDIKFRISRVIG